MNILACCFAKKVNFLDRCGGYVFDHSKPLIIEVVLSRVFLQQLKNGDKLILELADRLERQQAICQIIAIDHDESKVYLIPLVKLYVNYSRIEIRKLLQ